MKKTLLAFLVMVSTICSLPALVQGVGVSEQTNKETTKTEVSKLMFPQLLSNDLEERLERISETNHCVLSAAIPGADDVIVTTVDVKPATDPVTKYCQVNKVNIRKEPNTDSEVLDFLTKNEEIKVLRAQNDEWDLVRYGDSIAYVYSKFLGLEPAPVRNYTDEELYIMAHLLAGEVQGMPDQEQRYVGSVVLNRVKSSLFPNTIKEVVFDPGQYACTWDGNYYREPTERNWANAQWLLENGSVFPENVVFQSARPLGNGTYLKTQWNYFCYY